MAERENYQLKLEQLLAEIPRGEKLLLHSCCAPCSSYVLEYLSQYFEIQLFYYNPNIAPAEEYQRRLSEQRRLISLLDPIYPITLVEGNYEPDAFSVLMCGTETSPEGGERCRRCIAHRLQIAAEEAERHGCKWFTTTLTISPHKNAPYINDCGTSLAQRYDLRFLPSDFKKRGGYQRSIALSKQYDLYRQDYCGCLLSIQEAEERKRRKTE
ncbi:MAG: epoxyqueuosine reductase QueH [Ruminococcus sp.]|nr:epoxyqueuosine reductase QueH [Ruminococcus sp.]